MNPLLRKVMDRKVNGRHVIPQANKEVMRGTVEEVCKMLPEWLDGIFRHSMASLKEGIDLKYLGYNYLTPEEVYNRRFGMANAKDPYDLAHSDTYHVRFNFSFNGKELPPTVGVLHLPYAREGNLMTISGTRYVVAPVLSDTIISPDVKQIFVRLFKDKLTFKHYNTNILFNGEREECILVWTEIMKNTPTRGELGNPLSCIALYLLGKYGFKETVNKYFRMNVQPLMKRKFKIQDVQIRNGRDPELEKNYDCYSSTRMKPPKFKVKTPGTYHPTDVHIYIHKDLPKTSFIKNMVAGIIYSLEVMSGETEEIIRHIDEDHLSYEIFQWRTILAKIAYKGHFSFKKITKDIKEHFNSIEYYIDNTIRDIMRLNDEMKNMDFNNFYDLIYFILENYSKLTLYSKLYNSDITNRYIDVKYYITYYIIYAFNNVILDINKRLDKVIDNNKNISENEIKKMFQEKFRQGIIYSIVKGKTKNFNIIGADYCGDNCYPKCTVLLEDQSRGEGTAMPKKSRFPLSTRTIHGCDLVLGSILYLPKKNPSGRFRVNLYLNYNPITGKINIPEHLKFIVQHIDNMLFTKHVEALEAPEDEDLVIDHISDDITDEERDVMSREFKDVE